MTSDQRSQGSIRTRHVAVCRVCMDEGAEDAAQCQAGGPFVAPLPTTWRAQYTVTHVT